MNTLNCFICQKKPTKFARAHLLPDSLKKVAPPSGRPDNFMMEVRLNSKGVQKKQTHEWDGEILCEECDQSLGPYDKALKEFVREWYHSPRRSLSVRDLKKGDTAEVGADSNRVAIGLAACLFRCQISKRCDTVAIGAHYENELAGYFRVRGRDDIPNNFSCLVIGALRDPDGLCEVMQQPFLIKVERLKIHVFLMYGLIVLAKFGKAPWLTKYGTLAEIGNRPDKIDVQLIPFENSPIADLIVRAGHAQGIWDSQ